MGERAAIYSRVSTLDQEREGTSLGTQAEANRRYAETRGYRLRSEHQFEDVHSGADLWDRPHLGRLREAIRRGELDVVVCYAVDRLSRSQTHLAILVDEADRHGARYEFVTEDFERSTVGEFIRSAKAFAAQVEREKIMERTERGRRARVASGRMLPGNRPPYGYSWGDEAKTCLVENPDTGPVVRRIFREVAAGGAARAVAARLTAEGVLTPMDYWLSEVRGRGLSEVRPWSIPTITQILRHPAYVGDARAFRYKWVRTPGQKGTRVEAPEAEQVRFGCPALVTPEVAAAAVAQLGRNKSAATRNNRNPEGGLLRGGFVKCGYCGLTVRAVNRKDRTTYRCNQSNADRHRCPSFAIDAPILDAVAWAKVEGVLTDPAIILAEVERLRSQDPTAGDVAAVERRLSEVARKQANLVRRLADVEDDALAALVQTELASLAEHGRQLEAEREALARLHDGWRLAQEQLAELEAWCANVAANLGELNYEQKRLALQALGVEVRVWRADHNPRWEVTAAVPLVSTSLCSSSRCRT